MSRGPLLVLARILFGPALRAREPGSRTRMTTQLATTQQVTMPDMMTQGARDP